MVIFRENSEDICAGLEFEAGSTEAKRLREMLTEFGGAWGELDENTGIGTKPISENGSKRLVRAAMDYAVAQGRKRVTVVHKGIS
jgi:isocitrate dehydrogenase